MRDPGSAPHGGESIPQVLARVAAWIADRGRDPGHTVAITHASVIRAAIVHVIQAQLPSFWRIDVVPLSQTDLRTNGRRWVLRSMGPSSRAKNPDQPQMSKREGNSMSSSDRRFLIFGIGVVVALLILAVVNLYQAQECRPSRDDFIVFRIFERCRTRPDCQCHHGRA